MHNAIIPQYHPENEVFMHDPSWHKQPHRRFNPLTGEWILVSPHRTSRPWDGQQEISGAKMVPRHETGCYLCPGNQRASGEINPDYKSTYVFTNDYAALLPESNGSSPSCSEDELLRAKPESGFCRVICYHPRHDLTMAGMQHVQIERVISAWQREYLELGSHESVNYVQIFENKGFMMGCSNPHPHGQIWATSSVPTLPSQESFQQLQYGSTHKGCLLCTYLEREFQENERILFENSSFVALVPYWAVWPFETMVLPKRHNPSINSLTPGEKTDLAEIMQRLTICYDNLFETSFPYSMGIHQQPTDSSGYEYWHYHIHFLPPLLRSATIKKHMVGFELLAMAQRDLTAESAARLLREMPGAHYLDRGDS